MNQRFTVEKELYIANNRSQLFPVCVLNFIRCSCERNGNTSFFFKSLASASKEEVAMFFKVNLWNYTTERCIQRMYNNSKGL